MNYFRRHLRLTITVLSLSLVIGFAGLSAPADAQFGIPQTTVIITDVPRMISEGISKAAEVVKNRIKDSIAIAFKNGVRTFLATTVREFATALATTQPGQKPLFVTKPMTLFRDIADAAAGDFIDDFTRGITGGKWDPRCDSKDPAIRAKCVGLTGGTAGLGEPTSGERGRFIISRLLRAGVNSTLDSCLASCKTQWGIIDSIPSGNVSTDPRAITNFDTYKRETGFNDYEAKVMILQGWLDEEITPATKETGKTVICRDVVDAMELPTGASGPAAVPVWWFGFGKCRDNAAGCEIPATDCQSRTEEAILNLGAEASKGQRQCTANCRSGFGADVRKLTNEATATDIFAYVENFDVRRSPKLIAERFKGNSDFSQYFQATAVLVSTVEANVTGQKTLLNAGTLPRTSKVSEQVLSPKEASSALFGVPFYDDKGELTFTGTGVADIIKGIASFVNSPVGKALFTYFRSKCGLNADACKGPTNTQSVIGRLLFGSGGATGVAAARVQFAGLGKAEFITGNPGQNDIDVLTQLSSAGLLDPQFRTAIEDGLTVQEALNQNLLNGQKTVGFTSKGIEASDGYPYRSLQYLRKYRIIPVGWELASQYSYSFSNNDLTLKTLTEQFAMCAQDSNHYVCSESLKSCNPNLIARTCNAGTNVGNACTTNSECPGTDSNGVAAICNPPQCGPGERCGASPYCGLVDPNWVLKAPQTFCRRQGAGEEIIAKEFVCDKNNVRNIDGEPLNPSSTDSVDDGVPNCVQDEIKNLFPDIGRWVITRNTDTCADTQSCIKEDDDGTCLAYGYCVQERQTFKFDGDQCDAENVSCQTYTDSKGRSVSYLARNLDTSCGPDDVGCQWYCAMPSYDEARKAWTCTESDGAKINFTSKVQTCPAGSVGCRQFIRVRAGTNILPNGGFEEFEGGAIDLDPAFFQGWSAPAASMNPVTATDSGVTNGNDVAVRVAIPAGQAITQSVNVLTPLSERTFTFSVRAKVPTGVSCTGQIQLCSGAACDNPDLRPTVTLAPTNDWQTFAVSQVFPTGLSSSTLRVNIIPDTCGDDDLQIDSAMLEETNGASPFVDYGTTNLVHLNGKRLQCAPADVGCEKYTPVAGGTAVNGIIAPENRCTADQVGCQLYSVEAISQIPARVSREVTVVASKGQQCRADDVGCEEYTNLDEVARGGEGKAYYKNVKQCSKPSNPNVTKKTYYTWVGDPDRGFVLRSQQLVTSNLSSAPCTNMAFGTTTSDEPACADTAETVIAATCSLGELGENPDCTEYYDSNLNTYYRLKSKTVSVTEDCRPFRNTIDETDPDYAANKGRIYYLAPKENTRCTASGAACRAYVGNSGRAPRQIISEGFNSSSLGNWVGGSWSTAAPNAGGHSLRIDPAASSTSGVAFTPLDIIAKKLVPGKTYQVTVTAAAASSASNIRLRAYFGTGSDSTGLFNDPSGVGFQSGPGVELAWNDSITPAGAEWRRYTIGPVTLGETINPEWRLGLVIDNGPGYIDSVVLTEISDRLYIVNKSAPDCPRSAIGCTAYRDRAGTPAYATGFARLCSDQVVGCEVMIDTQNSSTPFTQTINDVTTPADKYETIVNDRSVACAASAKGCDMFGDPIYGADDRLTGFKTVTLRNDPDRYETDICLDTKLRCEAYKDTSGLTTYFKDPRGSTCEYRTKGTTPGWYVVGTNFNCPTVKTTTVKQPIGKSCSPVCVGGTREGRACRTIDDCPGVGATCFGDPLTMGMINVAGVPTIGQCAINTDGSNNCLGNNACVYYVGSCPDDQSGCSEYRDPTEPISCRSECALELNGGTAVPVDASCTPTVCASANKRNGQSCRTNEQCFADGVPGTCVGADGTTPTVGAPGCRPYYYLRQSIEDTAGECNGEINTAIGCRPFNDTADPNLNYRGQ